MGKSSLPRLREAPYTYAPQNGALFVDERSYMGLQGAFRWVRLYLDHQAVIVSAAASLRVSAGLLFKYCSI
jgi:hypothetical protein